ncbi:MAG TPA: hypothetical protein VK826_14715, partial [Bacteroidia bacterium]|nr:hypothetical protein [Bacteroidia bacterium]
AKREKQDQQEGPLHDVKLTRFVNFWPLRHQGTKDHEVKIKCFKPRFLVHPFSLDVFVAK